MKKIDKFEIDSLTVNIKSYSLQIDFNKQNIEYFNKFIYDSNLHHSYGKQFEDETLRQLKHVLRKSNTDEYGKIEEEKFEIVFCQT